MVGHMYAISGLFVNFYQCFIIHVSDELWADLECFMFSGLIILIGQPN